MSITENTVTIIGSGWLGRPLAQHLQKQGLDVCVTSTSTEKKAQLEANDLNVIIFPNAVSDEQLQKRLSVSQTVIITIPPGNDYEKTGATIRNVLAMLPEGCRVFYTSSTGVYRHLSTSDRLLIIEENAEVNGPLANLESIITTSGKRFVVCRLGGLCGPGRHPGRFLAGKKNVADGNTVVNLVHLTDVIRWMTALLKSEVSNEVFQITADEHPQRQDYYPFAALQIGRDAPEFESCPNFPAGISVSNSKIKATTGLSAIYPNPFEFEYED